MSTYAVTMAILAVAFAILGSPGFVVVGLAVIAHVFAFVAMLREGKS